MSHPVWVRGLKHPSESGRIKRSRSHPVWVRGLKLDEITDKTADNVAPRVGAWIETLCRLFLPQNPRSHPVWVRGLKQDGLSKLDNLKSRTPCGCVD